MAFRIVMLAGLALAGPGVDDARILGRSGGTVARGLLAVAVVLVVAGCGSEPAPAVTSAAAALTVSGSVTVKGGPPQVLTENELTCRGGGGFDDLRQGAQVVVTDAAGTTIALGQLSGGSWKRGVGCIFLFTVPDVPGGEKFYGVEISHRGRAQYTAAQIAAPLAMEIGS
ncbi:hypothetical protein [Nonomuraea sp. NPDC005692]|uniref:hypothetical protein n=1 Tax=Nonomuraea sp. NPDC005692 TaxID=3157168 RepID=UPI0033D89BEC